MRNDLPTPERFRVVDRSRPISIGRTIVAIVLAGSPGLLAGSVVWPLLADRWKPLCAAILVGTSLFSIALVGGAGWLVRRVPAEMPDLDESGPDEPLIDFREDQQT